MLRDGADDDIAHILCAAGVRFNAAVPIIGGSATVTITFPEAVENMTRYYKVTETGFVEFDGAVFDGNSVILSLLYTIPPDTAPGLVQTKLELEFNFITFLGYEPDNLKVYTLSGKLVERILCSFTID